MLYVIASGAAGFEVSKGFASNGYEAHSLGKYSLFSCFLMDGYVSVHHHGLYSRQSASMLRSLGPWPDTNDDPFGQHSRNQHLSQSSAKHRTSVVRQTLTLRGTPGMSRGVVQGPAWRSCRSLCLPQLQPAPRSASDKSLHLTHHRSTGRSRTARVGSAPSRLENI